jgi:hypothetical protein
MAYQPSNSGRSVGTTVKDQHSRYFQSIGDAQSPRTIFFEQLIAQLALWKASDNNIILLGDFNKNVYTGHLARVSLRTTSTSLKYAANIWASPFPQLFAKEVTQSMVFLQHQVLNASTCFFCPILVLLETTDALLLTSLLTQ